ncbi:hypothetical protein K474DRAFT_1597655 [Panus rudis PR-1116 ss-1]|nr:hypothetical protein K474DRAFT_1597655 [Panus rudis PR-1116 ss-1]
MINNAKIVLREDDYPSFLYDQDIYAADPKHRASSGLLRGPLLKAAFRNIFTGKRTAKKLTPGGSAGKAPISKINGMTQVHPQHIAYIAVLTRFALNAQSSWQPDDGAFSGEAFYLHVALILGDLKRSWERDTLNWWNL